MKSTGNKASLFAPWVFDAQYNTGVSQEQICSGKCTCCNTQTEVVAQTCPLTLSQYTDTRPTNPDIDPVPQGVWQGGHVCTNFQVTDMVWLD